MPAPLTNAQKRYLITELIRPAFARAGAEADGQSFDEWRLSQVLRACGKAGLRCCSQDDYGAVKAHFLAALGREGQAMAAAVRGAPAANRRRQAAWALRNQWQRMGLSEGYAAGICRQMSRGAETLATASEGTLWKVYYALRKQARRMDLTGDGNQKTT